MGPWGAQGPQGPLGSQGPPGAPFGKPTIAIKSHGDYLMFIFLCEKNSGFDILKLTFLGFL